MTPSPWMIIHQRARDREDESTKSFLHVKLGFDENQNKKNMILRLVDLFLCVFNKEFSSDFI